MGMMNCGIITYGTAFFKKNPKDLGSFLFSTISLILRNFHFLDISKVSFHKPKDEIMRSAFYCSFSSSLKEPSLISLISDFLT